MGTERREDLEWGVEKFGTASGVVPGGYAWIVELTPGREDNLKRTGGWR